MKNLFLTIILSSTCFMMYGQVKGPDKGVKVTNTPTSTESSSVIYKGKEKAVNVMPSKPKPIVSPVGRAVKPGSQGEKVKPTGNSKPSGASSAAPERGQRPQSQMDAERPTASPERGKAPQSQMEKEVPSKVSSKTSAVKTPVGGEGDDAFCNGWRDGYIKEWNAKSNEFVTPKVPPCEENANLEGYKNGYKAGMKRAQLDKK